MAPSVAVSWSGSYAPPLSLPAGSVPAPGNLALPVPVAIPAGDWAVAAVTWRQPAGAPPVTIASVADDLHSPWNPLGAPQATSDPAGVTRTVWWYCPRVRAQVPGSPAGAAGPSLVQASPTGFVLSLAMTVLDVTGMTDWIAVVAPATGYLPAPGTALSMSVPPSGSSAILFAAAGSDLLSATISGPGSGWTAIAPVTASNGSDATSDLQLNVAWQVTSGGALASWASTAPVDFSGVLGGLIAAPGALVQPNPNWPIVITEAAIGAGRLTPADQMSWTPLAAPVLDLANYVQGRNYERAELATGDGVLTVDNPSGLLLPPEFPQSAGIDSGTPVRLRCYWPGLAGGPADPSPWHVPVSGFIERMPQAWDACRRGFTEAEINDLLASLTGDMQPVLPAEIHADGPVVYCPLTDQPGSLVASDLVPGGAPLYVTASKYGLGSGPPATQAFGATPPGSGIPGAAGVFLISPQYQVSSQSGMWQQVVSGPASGNAGVSLTGTLQAAVVQVPGNTGPSLAPSPGTVEFWFQPAAPANTPNANYLLTVQGIRGNGFAVVLNGTTGYLQLYATGGTSPIGSGGLVTISAVDYLTSPAAAAAPTHVAITFSPLAWTAYVNGAEAATGSWAAPLAGTFAWVSLNGFAGTPLTSLSGGSGVSNYFAGYLGHLAVFPRILHPARIATHYAAGATGMAGDPASYRIERILADSGTASLRRLIQYETSFEAGGGGPDAVVSCSDWAGSAAGQAVNNMAGSTPPGMTFVTPGGELFTLSKENAFGQPAKWVLGEDVEAGEVPYLSDFALGYDPQRVINDVALTQLDSQNVVTSQVPAITQASEDQYGPQTVNGTGYLQGDATKPLDFGPGLYDLANDLANTFRRPLARGEVVTVDAARYPSAWRFVLAASVGDMVQLNRRPVTMQGTISIPGRISQTTRNLSFGHGGTVIGSIQCIIDAAPEAFTLTCDDPVLGQLDGRNVLAWLCPGLAPGAQPWTSHVQIW